MIKDLFEQKKPTLSFEVFPPKKDDEFEGVYSTLDKLSVLKPDFISVTFGGRYKTYIAFYEGIKEKNCFEL